MAKRIAVVLFSLGGPDSLEAVGPYLRNLFSDPAILRVPGIVRGLLARVIADRRTLVARQIFAEMGGASTIVSETEAQASALGRLLVGSGLSETRVFFAMRYWHPRAAEVAGEVLAFSPELAVLLPLYPQFSTTTTESSIDEFEGALSAVGYQGRVARICCFPSAPGLVAAIAASLEAAIETARANGTPRILFSAHGLPERIVRSGDPYVFQVEETVRAVVEALARPALEWEICYQSRVGPLKWTGPSIDESIAKAVAERRAVVLAPIAFVSEHSETLVELDIKYRHKALAAGALAYVRVPTVGIEPRFIAALAGLVRAAAQSEPGRRYCNTRVCPRSFRSCPNV